jgi:hypothetical protein
MKKVILMAAATLAFVATSFAQNATTPAPKTKMMKKPTMEAPAQGTPAPAQGTPAPAQAGQGKGRPEGQTRGQGRGRNEGEGRGAMSSLGLSAEQETQFKAINQAHKLAVKTVQSNESLAIDAKKAQVADLMSKYEVDVKAIMSAEQFEKWLAMRAKRNERKNDRKDDDKDDDKDEKKGNSKGNGKGKSGHDKMGDAQHDEQGHAEGTEGYDPKTPTDGTPAPADLNKKRKPKKN